MARRKIKANELKTFDAAEYLTAILEENDPGLLAVALGRTSN